MKVMDALRRAAERQGWTVKVRRNGHLVWVAPNGVRVYSSATPSCDGAPYDHVKLMRREGFRWPTR